MVRGLTDARLRNAKPATKFYVMSDGGGLYIRIMPGGKKVWHFLRMENGKRHRLDFGVYDRMSLADARAQAIKYNQMIDQGIDPQAAKQQRIMERTTAPTVEQFSRDSFFPFLKRERKHPDEPKRHFERDILPKIGTFKIRDVKRLHVKAVIKAIGERGATRTANMVGVLLRQFFAYAIEEGVLDVSPFPVAQKKYMGGTEISRNRVLNHQEIGQIWIAATQLAWPFGHALKLLLLTGQRRNELRLVKKTDLLLNDHKPTWTIPKENIKQTKRAPKREDHIVPLSPLAAHLFREAMLAAGDSNWVFASQRNEGHDKPLTEDSLNRCLYRYRAKDNAVFNVAHWTPHDLRRTLATGMAEDLNIPPHVIEAILNHTLQGVAGVYNRGRYRTEMCAALNAWASHVEVIADIAEQQYRNLHRLAIK